MNLASSIGTSYISINRCCHKALFTCVTKIVERQEVGFSCVLCAVLEICEYQRHSLGVLGKFQCSLAWEKKTVPAAA